jgi:hypothetical protein
MPWKAVSLLWPAMLAALSPLDLKTMLERWPRLLARLAALDSELSPYAREDRSRPRQVERFRTWFGAELRSAA